MKLKQLASSSLLFIAAFIWGSAFIAQDIGMDHVGPLTFVCVRSFLACLVLFPLVFIRKKFFGTKTVIGKERTKNRTLVISAALVCGISLTLGTTFQQYGILVVSGDGGNVGKAGFITTMYVFLVPVIEIFLGKKINPKLWLPISGAVVALYLLSVKGNENMTVGRGDFLLILCALAFSVQILAADYYIKYMDGVLISALQFLFCGLISVVPMFVFEKPDVSSVLIAWKPLLYAGILSSGVAFTLQIIGQKNTPPALASLLMSCESLFAVLTAFVILKEVPTANEAIGGVIMFACVIFAQVFCTSESGESPEKPPKAEKEKK